MADSRAENTEAGHRVDGPGGQGLPPPGDPAGVLGEQPLVALRAPAVRRLLALRAQGALSRRHVRSAWGPSERTVWRWLAEASQNPAAAAHPGARRTRRFERDLFAGQARLELAPGRATDGPGPGRGAAQPVGAGRRPRPSCRVAVDKGRTSCPTERSGAPGRSLHGFR